VTVFKSFFLFIFITWKWEHSVPMYIWDLTICDALSHSLSLLQGGGPGPMNAKRHLRKISSMEIWLKASWI
jgi:hypothetical protein